MRSPVKARQAPKGVPSHLLPSKAAPAHTKQGAAGKKQARMAGGSHPEAEEEEELVCYLPLVSCHMCRFPHSIPYMFSVSSSTGQARAETYSGE